MTFLKSWTNNECTSCWRGFPGRTTASCSLPIRITSASGSIWITYLWIIPCWPCNPSESLYLYSMGEYSMGEALQKFLSTSRLKSDVVALQIGDIWEKLMGKTIARATDKIEIHGSTLFIHTYVASLKQELSLKKD